MEAERCIKCHRELVSVSDREMLLWTRIHDPRANSFAQICPECEDYYCPKCAAETGKSCPSCGATIYNAGVR
jgi:uncharacterized protein with PIN domain